MQTTDYNIPVFNNEDVADLNEYSNQMANALKAQLNRFGNPLTFKGNVATFADLPTEATGGWIYNVTGENKNYVYSGTEWVIYSENFDTGNLTTLDDLEEGIDSKLDKMVVSKSLNTEGWYRVAKYNVYGTFGKSFIINISTRYVNTNNMTASFIVNFINNKAKITNMSSLIHNSVIDRIRVVRDNDEYFVEIHYAYDVANSVYVDILNQHLHDTIKLSMLDFEAPTDTATVLDELSIGEMTVTNSNGTARKFPDGTMICTGTKTFTGLTMNQWGGVYSTGSGFIIFNNFPQAFVDIPIVTVSQANGEGSTGDFWIMSDGNNRPTKTSPGGYQAVRGSTTNSLTVVLSYIAIGRWK